MKHAAEFLQGGGVFSHREFFLRFSKSKNKKGAAVREEIGRIGVALRLIVSGAVGYGVVWLGVVQPYLTNTPLELLFLRGAFPGHTEGLLPPPSRNALLAARLAGAGVVFSWMLLPMLDKAVGNDEPKMTRRGILLCLLAGASALIAAIFSAA